MVYSVKLQCKRITIFPTFYSFGFKISLTLFFLSQISKSYRRLWDGSVSALRLWRTAGQACRLQKGKECHQRNELFTWYTIISPITKNYLSTKCTNYQELIVISNIFDSICNPFFSPRNTEYWRHTLFPERRHGRFSAVPS